MYESKSMNIRMKSEFNITDKYRNAILCYETVNIFGYPLEFKDDDIWYNTVVSKYRKRPV